MVGTARYSIEDVLKEDQVHYIVKEFLGGQAAWKLVECEVRPAAEGMSGFLGDHLKVSLHVKVKERLVKIKLFVKCLPLRNQPKADFIDENNFYRREMVMFKLFEDIEIVGPNPWSTKAYIYNESLLVLPDLAEDGYDTRNPLETLDLPHARLAAASVARFHAAFADYETKKCLQLNRPYTVMEEYGDIFRECAFKDTPWMRGAAKLTASYLDVFSDKYGNSIPNLEDKLLKLFLEACDDFTERKDTLNVLVHKDLWVNNIMFKYERGAPTNAVLIDFQCLRYGPPAFDLMSFLYLTTSRNFRAQNEDAILNHYFNVFMDSVNENTESKLKDLGYDLKDFLRRCESSRRFGLLESICIYPYVLLDPASAREMFDDPETYAALLQERTAPVLAHARRCAPYRTRQLEVAEEFVERYVL